MYRESSGDTSDNPVSNNRHIVTSRYVIDLTISNLLRYFDDCSHTLSVCVVHKIVNSAGVSFLYSGCATPQENCKPWSTCSSKVAMKKSFSNMKKLDNFLTSEAQMRQRGLGLRQRIQEEGRGQGWIEQGGKQLDLSWSQEPPPLLPSSQANKPKTLLLPQQGPRRHSLNQLWRLQKQLWCLICRRVAHCWRYYKIFT